MRDRARRARGRRGRRAAQRRPPSCGAPRTSSRRSAARRAGTPTAATATSRRTPGPRCCSRPAAHGVAAIDTVHLEIADRRGPPSEADDAAALGFAATACIHPSQVVGRARRLPPRRGASSSGRARVLARPRTSAASSRSAARWSTRPCCARRRRSCVAPAAPERDAPIPVLRCEDITPLRHHSGGHAGVQRKQFGNGSPCRAGDKYPRDVSSESILGRRSAWHDGTATRPTRRASRGRRSRKNS